MTRKITIAIIEIVIILLVAWDIYVAIEPTPRDTISKIALDSVTKHPSIAVLIAIVMGHLFWPMAKMVGTETSYWKYTVPILAALWIGSVVLDILGMLPRVSPILYILIFVPLGHYLWPQKG